jgi:hypothetical protein
VRLRAVAALGVALVVSAAAAPCAAATKSWTESDGYLAAGYADGVAVTEGGRLFLAPRLTRVSDAALPGEPAHVWSMVADADGGVYLGTGPDGHILHVSPAGRVRLFFTAAEPMVTSLALARGGDLLAGTAPGGRIYRIRPDGSGEVWAETNERYVWALAAGNDGELYAGTGEQGLVLRIEKSGDVETFFDSDEPHVVRLVAQADGRLLAGSSGSGLVYQIDADGNAIVLYDDDLAEVAGLVAERDGSVLAAFVARLEPEARRPAVQIQLPEDARVGAAAEGVSSLEETSGPTLRGVIEGLEPDEEPKRGQLRGRLVHLGPAGEVTTVWRSTRDAPLCLVLDPRGHPLLGSGEPARLVRADAPRDMALLATLSEAQVTRLLPVGDAIYVATSNPATLYRLETDSAESGVFLSRAFDAGSPARWGSIHWEPDDAARANVELYTRTGNSDTPDETWSAWSPALTDAGGSAIVNPSGRYLQWRARFVGPGSIRRVSVLYEPVNRPPVINEFALDPDTGATSGPTRFRWNTFDPDGDPVGVSVEYRALGSEPWIAIAEAEPENAGDGSAQRPPAEGTLAWDPSEVAEGVYEIRASASDEAANHPGQAGTVTLDASLRVTVDRSPPEIRARRQPSGTIEVVASDGQTRIERLEVLAGSRVRFTPRPIDGVCDSPSETFRFELPAADPDAPAWSLRGFDAAGNEARATVE